MSNTNGKLRGARDRKGYSRERVAARLGISAKTLERWENGDSPIKLYRLEELAGIYGVSVDDLTLRPESEPDAALSDSDRSGPPSLGHSTT